MSGPSSGPVLPFELILVVADFLDPAGLCSLVEAIPSILELLSVQHMDNCSSDGDTFLHHLIARGKTGLAFACPQQMLRHLEARPHQDSLLHYAARSGQEEIVSRLIKLGSDVNHKGNYGFTPLLCAVF